MNARATFIKIWAASFISTIGTFMLLLAITAKVYTHTHSVFYSSLVFPSQWIAGLFLLSLIGNWSQGKRVHKRFLMSECCGAFFSVLAGYAFNRSALLLFLFLSLRGIGENATKAVRSVSMKRYFDGDERKKASSLINSSYYLGTGAGALLGSYFINYFSILELAYIDGATFIVSGILYYSVGPEQSAAYEISSGSSLKETLNEWKKHPSLLGIIGYTILAVAAFQGFHNLCRGPLPITVLNIGEKGVLYFQLTFCIGITLATIIVKRYFYKTFWEKSIPYMIGGLLLIPLIAYTQLLWLNFVFYFLMALIFEIIFTINYKEAIEHCPEHLIGKLGVIFPTFASLAMTATILFFGKIMDWKDFQTGSLILFCFFELSFLASFVFYKIFMRKYVQETSRIC